MSGRLTLLQRAMLEWHALHAYNACDVARLLGTPVMARLQSAADAVLEAHGLTGLTIDAASGTYVFHGGPARSEVRLIESGSDPDAAVGAELCRQVNTPFVVSGRFCPVRFFVVPAEDSFWLGLVYLHAIGSGVPAVFLMKRVIDAYRGGVEIVPGIDLYPGRQSALLRRPMAVFRKLASVPSLVRDLGSVHRPEYRDHDDHSNGFASVTLGSEHFSRLLEAGKAWDVTVNDLLLALLLKALGRCAPGRLQRKLALGCIVDLGKDLGADSRRAFGPILGFFVVTHAVPAHVSLEDLAMDIRRQTRRIKREGLYLGLPLELAVARATLPFFPADRRHSAYAKHYPLWGGLSNIHLDALWDPRASPRPADYIRAVSTGPVAPLVLAVTTVNDTVTMGVTYRSTVFSTADVDRVRRDVLDTVIGMEKSSQAMSA